jgi:hypothetical protein
MPADNLITLTSNMPHTWALTYEDWNDIYFVLSATATWTSSVEMDESSYTLRFGSDESDCSYFSAASLLTCIARICRNPEDYTIPPSLIEKLLSDKWLSLLSESELNLLVQVALSD